MAVSRSVRGRPPARAGATLPPPNGRQLRSGKDRFTAHHLFPGVLERPGGAPFWVVVEKSPDHLHGGGNASACRLVGRRTSGSVRAFERVCEAEHSVESVSGIDSGIRSCLAGDVSLLCRRTVGSAPRIVAALGRRVPGPGGSLDGNGNAVDRVRR